MLLLNFFADFIHNMLHLDKTMEYIVTEYQTLTYLFLFAIIFVETGLVVFPFLPGDSLLFAAGAFAAKGDNVLNIWVLIPLLIIAALLGDNTNYFMGRRLGVKIFDWNIRFLKKEYLHRTEAFFEKHGGKTIILARYIPIVRTFTPFVAGMGAMGYRRFLVFSVIAASIWVPCLSLLGYFFGQLPFVKNNFEIVIIGIVATSVLPVVFQMFSNWRKNRATGA